MYSKAKRILEKSINLPPHQIFLILALFFGPLIMFITPPLQVADETNHLYRAYQISEGNFKAEKENSRLGGYIPESLKEFAVHYKVFSLNQFSRISKKHIQESKEIALNPNHKIFIDFPNTALYSPISYLPQSIAIFFLRIFNTPPYYLLYIARLVSLLFWISMVYLAIKVTPLHKWLFVFLALLPMSIATNSSLSADMMTNALSFLLISFLLKATYTKDKVRTFDVLILAILILSLGFAKIIYTVLIGIFLIIPFSKFNSIKKYFIVFGTLLIVGFGASLVNNKSINKLYTPYNEYNPKYINSALVGYKANMHDQISYIKENKLLVGKVFVKSFFNEFENMTESYIGVLGWGDTKLPKWFLVFNYIIIFLIAIGGNYQDFKLSIVQKSIILFTSLVLLGLIMISQYLTWDIVGSNRVYPLLGRYFIPIFPLIFLLLNNKFINVPQRYIRNIAIVACLFSGFFVARILYNRFYYNYELTKKWELFYDNEQVNIDKKYAIINNDTVAGLNLTAPTTEKAFSGSHSIKLTKNKNYAFTHIIKKANKGDKIEVSVWMHGELGTIVINEFTKGGFYHKCSTGYNETNDGWRMLKTEFFVPENITDTELRIYTLFSSSDSSYFDDFKISYYAKSSSSKTAHLK